MPTLESCFDELRPDRWKVCFVRSKEIYTLTSGDLAIQPVFARVSTKYAGTMRTMHLTLLGDLTENNELVGCDLRRVDLR